MYYFINKKDIVEKYYVTYNKEEIEKIKIEIINNCSEIEHHEYDSSHAPNRYDFLKIRNFKEKFVGIQESRDTLQYPDKKIYHYSYDEYKYPDLVYYIDELLKGNVSVLVKIFHYTNNQLSIEERLEKASLELDSIDNFEIDKKRAKLDEIQKLIELKELNKNQKNVDEYVEKLKNLITLELVDTISKKEIDRVNSFFENTEDIKKLIKK